MQRIDENHSFNIWIAAEVGSVEKAIILKDFYGWCLYNKHNNKHGHGGRWWTFNSGKALAAKYPYMKERSILRWLDELEADGWLESGNFNETGYDRTKWYTIDFERYDAVFSAIRQNGESIRQNDESIRQNDESIGQNGAPYHLITSPSLSPASAEVFNPTPESAQIWGEGSADRIKSALSLCHAHLKENPGLWKQLADKAKNHLTKRDFADELEAYFRYHCDNFMVMQSPVKSLESGRSNFISWLSQPICRKKYAPETADKKARVDREEQKPVKYKAPAIKQTTQK